MSAETDFRALLAARPQLAALVGTRIAQNAVPQGSPLPLVVFASSHTPERSTNGTLLADEVTFTVQCVAEDSAVADQVADEVEAAIYARAEVTARDAAFNEELALDATVLVIQWWDV